MICGQDIPLQYSTDPATGKRFVTRSQDVANQLALMDAVKECQRRQKGLLDAWPRNPPDPKI